MEELTSIVLSGIAWDAMKKGVNISANYLKDKLSNWILSDDKLEEISKCLRNIPEQCRLSEGMIKEYLNLNERLLDILKEAKSKDMHISQTIQTNNGVVVTHNEGGIHVTHYSSAEKPRDVVGENLPLIKKSPGSNSIRIVESFRREKRQDIIEGGTIPSVYANITIPAEVKKREGCQFSMILFSYIPSENWLNYFDAGYKVKFAMETSDNIKQVQFEIKDSHQQKFVDVSLRKGIFDCLMGDISGRESWKDVREICFTVFADDEYIVGENGFIRIKEPRLEK